jgi:signal peptidase I
MRFEAAYNLTDDTDGDDPSVHNNSISWVPGFDIDLPVHNVNLNVQEIGTYILKGDKIKDNGSYDVDYDADNCFSNNKLAVDISDSFMHENLKLDCQLLYGIERGDIIVLPKITYTIKTGMNVSASGMYIYAKDTDSEFYAWRNNSFVQLGVSYLF